MCSVLYVCSVILCVENTHAQSRTPDLCYKHMLCVRCVCGMFVFFVCGVEIKKSTRHLSGPVLEIRKPWFLCVSVCVCKVAGKRLLFVSLVFCVCGGGEKVLWQANNTYTAQYCWYVCATHRHRQKRTASHVMVDFWRTNTQTEKKNKPVRQRE